MDNRSIKDDSYAKQDLAFFSSGYIKNLKRSDNMRENNKSRFFAEFSDSKVDEFSKILNTVEEASSLSFSFLTSEKNVNIVVSGFGKEEAVSEYLEKNKGLYKNSQISTYYY